MARVLNAELVQNAYKLNRKSTGLDSDGAPGGAGKGKKRKVDEGREKERKTTLQLKIKPGESLAHFRRYVSRSVWTCNYSLELKYGLTAYFWEMQKSGR